MGFAAGSLQSLDDDISEFAGGKIFSYRFCPFIRSAEVEHIVHYLESYAKSKSKFNTGMAGRIVRFGYNAGYLSPADDGGRGLICIHVKYFRSQRIIKPLLQVFARDKFGPVNIHPLPKVGAHKLTYHNLINVFALRNGQILVVFQQQKGQKVKSICCVYGQVCAIPKINRLLTAAHQ